MTIYSRRKFLKTATASAAGLTFVPNSIAEIKVKPERDSVFL